ncbi:type I DNA topoisomerase [Legionella geestiana]|uniref:type I DNA topoisomerase n=1 Tax=Legionella geestiana TaxID=45065 RepID=UPI001092D7C6|nr:type I DNA topoisomerase [Legionella geestiana]QDQ40461.1 type I DNA topoisomerase [Legionella geestiana]
MPKHLVIVESPAKAKTIQKYLGNDYEVLASYGHVRDLPARRGSVNPDNHFSMTYQPIEKNARHIESIAKALKKADSLLLATDPDREGEAISWHVWELMRERNLLKDKQVWRIFFNEITKSAIQEAIQHPRQVSMDLVNAQQLRRALDYLVGFNLSPLLWKKIRRGLSAGRVQSPALRLIVEREEEIERFIAEEYWRISARCEKEQAAFEARLTHFEGEKLQQFSITAAERAHAVRDTLTALAGGELIVEAVEKKQRKRRPSPPFITSTLQQEAARKLGFTARKTMSVAQQLYEGIDIGTGTVGLVTYMRTDSVNLAGEAINEIREFIGERFGANNCPPEARVYKTKSKNAQEAHEAIRPTSVRRTPEMLGSALTPDQQKLYTLIWKRTIASQMADALIDTVAVDFGCGEGNRFRATGSTVAFPGFLSVYEEGLDDAGSDEDNTRLPALIAGERVHLNEIVSSQHFTEPPPRYSEASLVKALEEYDIGRPSTYAAIIHTLQQREYVVVEKKRFIPTDVGRIVNRFLTGHFTRYVDYTFTAELEDTLDAVARGEKDWIPVLESFWTPFIEQIQQTDAQVARKDVTTEVLEDPCPKCGKQLSIRLGKRGRFIGCSAYPECDYTRDLSNPDGAESSGPEVVEGRNCPACDSALHIKSGRYGRFIGCSNYPACKHMEPLEKPADTGVTCPKCHEGSMLQRKSRRGKLFYSCSRYPKCDYALWNEPLNTPCPQCAWPILTIRETKKSGRQLVCPKEGCGYCADAEG